MLRFSLLLLFVAQTLETAPPELRIEAPPGMSAEKSRLESFEAKRLAEASAWLEQYRQFWEASFARLDNVLEEMKPKKKKREKSSR